MKIKRLPGASTGGGFTRPLQPVRVRLPRETLPRVHYLLPRPETRGYYRMVSPEMAFQLMVAFGSGRK